MTRRNIDEKLSQIQQVKDALGHLYAECGYEDLDSLSAYAGYLSAIVLSCTLTNKQTDEDWHGMIISDAEIGKMRIPTFTLSKGPRLYKRDFYGTETSISNVISVYETPTGKTELTNGLFSNNGPNGKYCTYENHIESFSSDYIIHVANDTFNWCLDLTSVYLPNLLSAGSYSFRNCSNLKNLYIPRLRHVYGYYNFGSNTSLPSELCMNELSTASGSATFSGCRQITCFSAPKLKNVVPLMFDVLGAKYPTKITYINIPNVDVIENKSMRTYGDLCIDFRDRDPSLYSTIPTPTGLSIFAKHLDSNPPDYWNYSRNISCFVPSAMYEAWINDEDWLNNVSAVITNEVNREGVKDRHFYILSSEGR